MTTVRLELDPAKLRAARISRALTQEGLGKLAGLQSTTISRLETGERPARLSTIAALAGALGVEVAAIAELREEATA